MSSRPTRPRLPGHNRNSRSRVSAAATPSPCRVCRRFAPRPIRPSILHRLRFQLRDQGPIEERDHPKPEDAQGDPDPVKPARNRPPTPAKRRRQPGHGHTEPAMGRHDFHDARASTTRSLGSRDSWASHFAQGLPTSTPFVNAPDDYAGKQTSQGATERCLPGQKTSFSTTKTNARAGLVPDSQDWDTEWFWPRARR